MADRVYKIVPGDNLTKISKRFNVPIKFIVQRNPIIKDPNKIQAGWTIKIPGLSEIKAMTNLKIKQKYKDLIGKEPTKISTLTSKTSLELLKERSEALAKPTPLTKSLTTKIPKTYPSSYKPIPAIDPGMVEKLKGTSWVPSPEKIMTDQQPKAQLVWEKQPNWFKGLYNKIALETKEFIRGEKTEITAIRKETIKAYPLTSIGKDLISAIDIVSIATSPLEELLRLRSKATERQSGFISWDVDTITLDKKIYDVVPSIVKQYLPKPEEIAGKIYMKTSKFQTLMHEVLHSHFETSLIRPHGTKGLQTFERAWAQARKEQPWETYIVDRTIYDRYTGISFQSLQHERYAWFGEIWGRDGLDNFPNALKIWYSSIFK